jgi:hypothetical protein
MKIRVPQVIDILRDERASVNTSRLIWLPSQGVQYQVDGLIGGTLTREGDRFSGVSVAALNSTYFAEFSDAFCNPIAVGNWGLPSEVVTGHRLLQTTDTVDGCPFEVTGSGLSLEACRFR